MAVNHYFNNLRATNEQLLVEDLTIETIKIHGMDIVYLPRTLVNKDNLFGEDTISRFASNKVIEMYLESVNGFQGEQDLLSKFGLQVKDSASFIVSKRRFQKETGMDRPMEGDIVYLPLTRGLFEIKFVEHENPFYQIGKNYVFKLSVELFQFNQETFTTGESEVDGLVDAIEYNMYLGTTPVVGTFLVGDAVFQFTDGTITGGYTSADATGLIKSISGGTELTLETVAGDWKPTSSTVTRYVTSNNNAKYSTVSTVSNNTEINDYNDNLGIENTGEDILDFTEKNPFGDV